MAICGVCGTDFPTCYMDYVSICPKCGTTFYNDSPSVLYSVAEPGNKINNSNVEKKDNAKKHK